jgi:hypothetical protein
MKFVSAVAAPQRRAVGIGARARTKARGTRKGEERIGQDSRLRWPAIPALANVGVRSSDAETPNPCAWPLDVEQGADPFEVVVASHQAHQRSSAAVQAARALEMDSPSWEQEVTREEKYRTRCDLGGGGQGQSPTINHDCEPTCANALQSPLLDTPPPTFLSHLSRRFPVKDHTPSQYFPR